MDEITPVEVVVVVVRVPKIIPRVGCDVGSRGDDAAPSAFVDERVLLRVVCETFVGLFELGEAGFGAADVVGEIVNGADGAGEFAERFAAVVHAVLV